MAQEDNTPGRHDLAILVSIADELGPLVAGLSDDRREGDRRAKELAKGKKDQPLDAGARDAALRRELSASALERLISFLMSPAVCAAHPDVLRLSLHVHLEDNWRALRELQAGAPAELFRLPPGRAKRVASPEDAEFRGKVAAIVELSVMHGDPPDEPARRKTEIKACERVAAALRKIGLRTPRGSKSERGPAVITGGTVRGWLDLARDPTPKDNEISKAFRDRIELGHHWKAQGKSYGATAIKMMALLDQDMPGASSRVLRVLPLRGDPTPEK